MKKSLLTFAFIFLMGCVLVACGNNEESSTEPQGITDNSEGEAIEGEESAEALDEVANESTEEESIEVDKGLFNVEITLPAFFFEGQDMDLIMADAEEDGATDITLNDNGSLTYTIPKAQHQEIMKQMQVDIAASIAEVPSTFQSVKEIDHNSSFTEFTLTVEKEAYENSFDGFAVLGLGMSAMMYQVFDGVSPENNKVTFDLVDEETGEVYDTVIYPDFLEG
ncbi:hypothetical protein [Bacillus horti]|uniref:Antigen I/II N-terminal domain-containing protein n=1 Tax=Caldalkalibacillus horti TaxID=77523 RepID=A0ABT9W469_9BACI|nr:hypothetical protein [Bacillus horti]MDQ0167869.1 hypothetical protein [Bacillus horti]